MSVLTTLVSGFYTHKVGSTTYRVKSIIDVQLQADFARWQYDRAVTDLAAARPLYTDIEFTVERDKLRKAYRDGDYDFKSKRGSEVVKTLPGIAFLCSRLISDVDENTVLDVILADVTSMTELLTQIITDSFPELRHTKKNLRSMKKRKNG